MNKNFIDFIQEVKKRLPNAVDDDIVKEIAKYGFGDIDEFVAKFKSSRTCDREPKEVATPQTKSHLFSDKLLEKTLAIKDDECLRMLCNMVYFNSQGKEMGSVLSLNRKDDFEIVRKTVGGDEMKEIIKSVLKDPSKMYCTLHYDKNSYSLLGVEDIKKAIRGEWKKTIFPMVVVAPEGFQYLDGHNTDYRYYDDVVVPLLCEEFSIDYDSAIDEL